MTRCLLGVFAHPDDESFGPGATLAVHAAAGVDVHVATMTDGMAGTPAPGFPHGEELASIRAEELREAVSILGGTSHHLSYRDSGFIGDPRNDDPDSFINVDAEGPVADLVRIIRHVRPDVVLTHHSTGGYFHPDHIRCHHLTREAFFAAGDPDRFPDLGPPHQADRLYSDVISNRWIKVLVAVLRLRGKDPTRMGVNADVDYTRIGVPPSSITTRIDIRRGWPAKKAAGAVHASQRGGVALLRRVPAGVLGLLWRRDTFAREHPPAWPGLRETSFFH